MTPLQQTPLVNRAELKSIYDDRNNAQQHLLDSLMSEAVNFREKSARADAAAVEASNKVNLFDLLGGVMQEIGGQMDQATESVSNLDAQLSMANEGEDGNNSSRAFTLQKGIALQEDYLKFRNENPTDYVETAKFYNDRINQDLAEAPNEQAKLDYFDKAVDMKYSSMKNAVYAKQVKSKQDRLSAAGSAYNSILNQVSVDPYEINKPMVQINDITAVLQGEGLPADTINQARTQMAAGVVQKQITTFLDKGEVKTAAEALRDPTYKGILSPQQHADLSDVTAKMFIESKLNSYRKAEQRTGIAVLRSLPMTPDMPNAKKYADDDFLVSAQTMFLAPSEVTKDNYNKIGDNLVSYWNGQRIVGRDQVAYLENRLKYSQNAYEAMGYANAIDRAFNDPLLQIKDVAGQLHDSKSEMVGFALDLARLGKLGGDPADALKTVRDHYNSLDGRETSMWNKKLEKEIEHINFNSVVESAVDRWNVWYNPSNEAQAAKEAESIYRGAYLKTGSPDAALEMTKSVMARDYRLTEINGKKEIMKGAPEQFFPGREKEIVDGFHKAVGEFATSRGLSYDPASYSIRNAQGQNVRVRMQPIYNTTENETGGKKTYLVTDEKGGLIQRTDGNFLTYEVYQDPEAAKLAKAKMMEDLGFQRDATEGNIRKESEAEIRNYINGTKAEEDPLPQAGNPQGEGLAGMSARGVDMLKKHESYGGKFNPVPYNDGAGFMTIGYGHRIKKGYDKNLELATGGQAGSIGRITKEQAEKLLELDIQDHVKPIQEAGVDLNQNQYDALASLAFNIGPEGLKKSGILDMLKEGNIAGAVNQIGKYTHAGGRYMEGLANRRRKEQALFLANSEG